MKTEIVTERIAASQDRPVRICIIRGKKEAAAFLTDDEALELAGALRDCVQANHNYAEGMEVEKSSN